MGKKRRARRNEIGCGWKGYKREKKVGRGKVRGSGLGVGPCVTSVRDAGVSSKSLVWGGVVEVSANREGRL